jgi:hypothetical protein
VNFRQANQNDIAQILPLWQEHRVLLRQSDGRFTAPSATTDSADGWLKHPNCAVFVGVQTAQAETVRGYITDVPYGVGIIEELALDAHYYHPGLGRGLVKMARTWFAQHNLTHFAACVPRYHAVEQAFWRALGAHEDKQFALPLPPTLIWMTITTKTTL